MKRSLLLCLCLLGLKLLAADVVLPHRQDVPPNAPRSPQEALRHMTVPDGFRVDLVASEPDIVNPIAMTFDDFGRIWVTESVEYPRKPAGPGKDKVKLLEDRDHDGRVDKVTVLADDLNIPTGVAYGYGGVWVLNAPDLLFFREDNGKAISREVILTGFGRTDTHELPSSLTWGPDGWLYGLNGVFNESRVISKGKEFKFNCAMWRVHPRTHEFQIVCEGTSNPYGIAWDFQGSAIVEACHWANDHLFHFVETGQYQRQAGTYPPYSMRIGSITDHGHQKTAYCGIAMLDSEMFPEKYRGRIYVGNIHGGCLNSDRLERDGATYLAKAEPDLLSANDAWFMPVALKIGPDGALYVLDWYDQYHCSQDAARDPRGVDRLKGRLYRLSRGPERQLPAINLANEAGEKLIERLGSPNLFFRETAQRLLTEKLSAPDGNERLHAALERIVETASAPERQRVHALWALAGSGALDSSFHLAMLKHENPILRAWAVRSAGNSGSVSDAVRTQIASMPRDHSPDVQMQLAIAGPKIQGMDAMPLLIQVLANCGQDKLIPAIAWNNLHPLLEKGASRFAGLLAEENLAVSPALRVIAPLAIDRMLGAAQVDAAAVHRVLEFLVRKEPSLTKGAFATIFRRMPELTAGNAAAVREQLHALCQEILAKPESPLALGAQLLAARLGIAQLDSAAVRALFVSATEPDAARLDALEALIAFKDPALLGSVTNVLASSRPPFIRGIFRLLGKAEDPKLAEALIAQYSRLDPGLQPLAIELLLQREPWARQVLKAVREKRLPPVLSANHLRKILESNDREAVWEVEKVFGKVREERNPEREKVVAEMSGYLRDHPGDPAAGREVFRKTCSQCHTIHGEGGAVGPDISSNGRASFEQLLSNVFDPSLVIAPAYQVTTIVTLDGRNLSGLVTEENAQRIVLKQPGEGTETIPRSNIKYTRQSKLSMMPEGIENMLPREELANLFSFLAFDRPPEDPAAKLIPGAPKPAPAPSLQLTKAAHKLIVTLNRDGSKTDLVEYVMDPAQRPYLHPVRDVSGAHILTQDRPDDHPWQHGIFTGFHGLVNGHEYWMENDGHPRFARLLESRETSQEVSWRALTEFHPPGGGIPLEEEDAVTVHVPEGDGYVIDFTFLLRARDADVVFEKAAIGGLAVRMPWDKANPSRQTHLNSEGIAGRACEKQRAHWCTVERPFEGTIFGVAILDHPSNANHPPAWRVDDQGLIDPSITSVTGWTLPAGQTRGFRYRLLLYKGPASREKIQREYDRFSALDR